MLCSSWTDESGSTFCQWNYTITNTSSGAACCILGLSPIGLTCAPSLVVNQIWNITDSNTKNSSGEVTCSPLNIKIPSL